MEEKMVLLAVELLAHWKYEVRPGFPCEHILNAMKLMNELKPWPEMEKELKTAGCI